MTKNSSTSKIKLSSFDDLFGMNKSIKETGEVRVIPIEELYEFSNHPFKVSDNLKMNELVDSIREYGVLVPGIARIRAKGGYEIIAGHSRKHACEIAGIKEMPMYIKNLSNDEAIIAMVDSNIQREELLPSEKAKAYKMKYEAIKHQGKKGNGLKCMSEETSDSKTVIQRYIWLARLNDDLLDLVDDKKLGFTQAVDLSFLSVEEQNWVLSVTRKSNSTITLKKASNLKALSKDNALTEALVWEVLSSEDLKKRRGITINSGRLNQYFNDDYTEEEIESIILSLLDKWKQDSEK